MEYFILNRIPFDDSQPNSTEQIMKKIHGVVDWNHSFLKTHEKGMYNRMSLVDLQTDFNSKLLIVLLDYFNDLLGVMYSNNVAADVIKMKTNKFYEILEEYNKRKNVLKNNQSKDKKQ